MFFVAQPELAATLRAVAEQGARTMYNRDWAKAFVAAVQRDGGKVTLQDMEDYRPTWSEPAHTSFFNHDVYVGGSPNLSAYQLLTALNVASALHVDRGGAYWTDPQMFCDLNRISSVVGGGPVLLPQTASLLRAKGMMSRRKASAHRLTRKRSQHCCLTFTARAPKAIRTIPTPS